MACVIFKNMRTTFRQFPTSGLYDLCVALMLFLLSFVARKIVVLGRYCMGVLLSEAHGSTLHGVLSVGVEWLT